MVVNSFFWFSTRSKTPLIVKIISSYVFVSMSMATCHISFGRMTTVSFKNITLVYLSDGIFCCYKVQDAFWKM